MAVAERTFRGYIRPDGSVGIRNYVLVLPTVSCGCHVASRIAELAGKGSNSATDAATEAQVVSLTHQHGCSQFLFDAEQTERTLVGTGLNPNVAAVLVVGLGCEIVKAEKVAEQIARSGKPVRHLNIQEAGGSIRTIQEGVAIVRELLADAERAKRQDVSLDKLILGTECGGSDATSGLAANPTVGAAADLLIAAGGTVFLSETTELVGGEEALARRCGSDLVRQQTLDLIYGCEKTLKAIGVAGGDPGWTNLSPGNVEGGLTTLEEKSLGCIEKGGHSPIQEVIRYAQRPSARGLVIMDTPGNDVESVCGMAAGGAQVVVFTTGRGTPVGNPIVPVIKVTGNPHTARRMADNIDLDASPILRGTPISEMGDKLYRLLLAVANGELTKAEILGHREFAITRLAVTL